LANGAFGRQSTTPQSITLLRARRKRPLERAGGIEALGREVAEDAAATKIVRGACPRKPRHEFRQPEVQLESSNPTWRRVLS
jgi:hypothetical protein